MKIEKKKRKIFKDQIASPSCWFSSIITECPLPTRPKSNFLETGPGETSDFDNGWGWGGTWGNNFDTTDRPLGVPGE